MMELPEALTLARQVEETVRGARILAVSIAEKRPRFLFTNEDLGAYPQRLIGRRVLHVGARGKWILAALDSGGTLAIGELFGRLRLVSSAEALPKTHHVVITFEDVGHLCVTIQAWGGVLALKPSELAEHPWLGRQGMSVLDPAFTASRFSELLGSDSAWARKPIKAFLVHEGNVRGIGNGYLQDILHRAKLSPKRKLSTLDRRERDRLHRAILDTMSSASERGGRDTEKDLFGAPGRYVPILDRRGAGTPCPDCGVLIEKISFLGGSCYVCPQCQPAP